MSTTVTSSRLLAVAEVAARLGVAPRSVYRWIDEGRLVAYQLGGPRAPLRIDEHELESWLRSSSPEPHAGGPPLAARAVALGDAGEHPPSSEGAPLAGAGGKGEQ